MFDAWQAGKRGLRRGGGAAVAFERVALSGISRIRFDGLYMLRIRYLVLRVVLCVVFSRLAILRIDGCLNSTP